MRDPASVNVAVHITGLLSTDAARVLENTPVGAMFTADVSQPAIGGKRYTVRVEWLSIAGAAELTRLLLVVMTQTAAGEADHAGTAPER